MDMGIKQAVIELCAERIASLDQAIERNQKQPVPDIRALTMAETRRSCYKDIIKQVKEL